MVVMVEDREAFMNTTPKHIHEIEQFVYDFEKDICSGAEQSMSNSTPGLQNRTSTRGPGKGFRMVKYQKEE